MTMTEFIDQQGIVVLRTDSTDANPNMPDSADMDHWILRLAHVTGDKRRVLTVPFSMGSGHNGAEPELKDVLSCLASDASSIENAQSFEDWAAEFGYDTDSRKAERTYRTCEKSVRRLRRFLGEEAFTLLLTCEQE